MNKGKSHSWPQPALSVIVVSGLSDADNGKNDGLEWALANPFHYWNIIFTAVPLSSFLNERDLLP
jgi:hypothetical protein